MSKSKDIMENRHKHIKREMPYYVANMKSIEDVLNRMRGGMVSLDTIEEINNLSDKSEQVNYLMLKIVSNLSVPEYDKFKEILQSCGESLVCNKLTGSIPKMENDEPDLYSAGSNYSLPQEMINHIYNCTSRSVCYIRNADSREFVASGFIVGPAVDDPKTGSHRFLLTSYKDGHVFDGPNMNEAIFGYETGETVHVRLIPKIYASDEKLKYMLLALEPSEDLEKYIHYKANKEQCELYQIIRAEEPKLSDMLMTCGFEADKSFRLYLTKVSAVHEGVPEGVHHVGLGRCNVLGGLCINKDTRNIYAMSTSVEDESYGNVIVHKAAFIWDIIKDIEGKFQSPHCDIKAGNMDKGAFHKLFPKFKNILF